MGRMIIFPHLFTFQKLLRRSRLTSPDFSTDFPREVYELRRSLLELSNVVIVQLKMDRVFV